MADNNTSSRQPLHESIFVLALRILFLQFSIAVASILINILLVLLVRAGGSDGFLIITLAVSHVLLQTLDAILLVILVLRWVNTEYVITGSEILVRTGILNIQTTRYRKDKIEYVEVDQSLIGKLLNYGTIRVYNPFLKEEVRLRNIPNPYRYSKLIKGD